MDLPEVDTDRPSAARVYDLFLGGKDNFEADRALYNRIVALAPELPVAARENRKWLIKVVRHLAGEAGIDQFLDCGSGLPTVENTHEAAQAVNPEATVVYVDNDPVVLAHGRALLEENDRTHFVAADLTEPDDLLHNPEVTRHLDFDRPIGLIQCGTFHAVPDEADPAAIMAAYVAAIAPGSYVALTHFSNPDDGSPLSQLARQVEARFQSGFRGAKFRTPAQIERLFEGLEMLDPGLTPVSDWWPDGPRVKPRPDEDYLLLGALARKP
jgi:SAM-dependent methyltransferase